MTISEFDLYKIDQYCKERVPAHYLDKIRVESSIRGSSVTIVERRAPWTASLSEWSRHDVAQIRFSTVTGEWSLYWRDRNGKWHPLDIVEPGTIDEMLTAIDEDSASIFWG